MPVAAGDGVGHAQGVQHCFLRRINHGLEQLVEPVVVDHLDRTDPGAVALDPIRDAVLSFIRGVLVEDPDGLLCGKGKFKRFVPIGSETEAGSQRIAGLIKRAAVLEPWE